MPPDVGFLPGSSSTPYYQTLRNVCGSRLLEVGTSRKITLGGAIVVDGEIYGLTVKHVLQNSDTEVEPENPKENEVRIYDSEWAEQDSSDTDSDDDVGEDTRGGNENALAPSSGTYLSLAYERLHPARAVFQSLSVAAKAFDGNSDTIARASMISIQYISWLIQILGAIEQEHRSFHFVESALSDLYAGRPLSVLMTSFPSEDHGDLDWALVKLDPFPHYMNGPNQNRSPSNNELIDKINDIHKEDPRGCIHVLTCRGTIVGTSTGNHSILKPRKADRALNVWPIHMNETLGKNLHPVK